MAAPIYLARPEALGGGRGEGGKRGEGAGGNKRRRVLSDTGSCLSGGGRQADGGCVWATHMSKSSSAEVCMHAAASERYSVRV